MMKTFKLIVLCCLLLVCTHVSAQNYEFKVMVSKGKNEYKTGGAWQPIKVGSSLAKNDEVRLGENSYLGLVHTSGKPLELKKSGSHKVSALASNMQGGTSVLNKYTDFILSTNENPNNKNKATGAVHRGINTIDVYLPAKSVVAYRDELVINWDSSKFGGPYIVTFISLFGDELKTITTNDPFVKINLKDKEFQNEDNINFMVKSKTNRDAKSDEVAIKRLSKADNTRIGGMLNEINQDIKEKTALNKYVEAAFFEQNNLLLDANTAYYEAIQLAPDVPEFKQLHEQFLVRTGLKRVSEE